MRIHPMCIVGRQTVSQRQWIVLTAAAAAVAMEEEEVAAAAAAMEVEVVVEGCRG